VLELLKMVVGLCVLIAGVSVAVYALTARFRHVRQVGRVTLTLQQYLQKHPEAKTRTGIKCVVCHSRSIKNWGLEKADDDRRIFICNQCNTRLYRSENW